MGAVAQIHGKDLLRVDVQGQPKNLVVLRGNGSTSLFHAHLLVEEVNARHGTSLTVVSHKVADAALTVGETWKSLPVFAVDAVIAYEKPGTKLDKVVDFFSRMYEPRVVLATGRYQGEKDVALVALGLTSADFKREESSIVLDISDDRLTAVQKFPALDGWYLPHAETGVPQGERVDADSTAARFLYRLTDGSSYAGLLTRLHVECTRRHGVYANSFQSDRFGVVAEVPEADVTKIQALLKQNNE